MKAKGIEPEIFDRYIVTNISVDLTPKVKKRTIINPNNTQSTDRNGAEDISALGELNEQRVSKKLSIRYNHGDTRLSRLYTIRTPMNPDYKDLNFSSLLRPSS